MSQSATPASWRQTISRVPRRQPASLLYLLPLLLLTVALWVAAPGPAAAQAEMAAQSGVAAVDCNLSAWSASNFTDFNDAVDCFNAKTTAGTYYIDVTGDLFVDDFINDIDNDIVDIELIIEGNNFTLDGTGVPSIGAGGLTVLAETDVTIQYLTVTNFHLNHAAIANLGGLKIEDSVVTGNTAAISTAGIDNFGALTIRDSILSFNLSTGSGGAIINRSAGFLYIYDSTILENMTDGYGGGIRNFGTMTMERSTVRDNTADGNGGAIANTKVAYIRNSTISDNLATLGGGIYHTTDTGLVPLVWLMSSTVNGNAATDAGGGIYGLGTGVNVNLRLQNSIIANSGAQGDCVGVNATFQVIDDGHNLIEDSANACGLVDGVNGNIVGQDPALGGLANNGGPTATHALLGGSPAIDTGDSAQSTDQRGVDRPQGLADDIGAFEYQLDCAAHPWAVGSGAALIQAIQCFNNETVAGVYTINLTQNVALYAGPPIIDNTGTGISLVINGNNFTVDGQDISGVRPFYINFRTLVTMSDITITGGHTTGSGGGVLNYGTLHILDSAISGNYAAGGGGGIANGRDNQITNSTIAGNYAGGTGGGINNSGTLTITAGTIAGNTANGNGGGIYNFLDRRATIERSTISGNNAASGGGFYNQFAAEATINNSTLSDNGANSFGGGIFVGDPGDDVARFVLSSSTLSDNHAGAGGGLYATGPFRLQNAILANSISGGSPGGDCTKSSSVIVDDGGHNLIEHDNGNPIFLCLTDGVNNNLVGYDPVLSPLQNNGGPTLTHALWGGSPAINNGDTAEIVDQRGQARPQLGVDDIGAVEVSCAAYQAALASPAGYLVGTASPDPAADLRMAVRCAHQNFTDDRIDLGGQVVSYTVAPPTYDVNGYNALFPILTEAVFGDLTIANGAIERAPSLATCNSGSADRSEFRLLYVGPQGNLSLENLALRNGCARDVDGSSGDVAGGAIYVEAGGLLRLNAVNLEGNSGGLAGALLNAGTVVGANSSFAGNSRNDSGTLGSAALLMVTNGASATFANTTFSENSAPGQSIIRLLAPGTLRLFNSTLADNTADYAIHLDATSGTYTFHNTLLADNSGQNCNPVVAGAPSLDAGNSYSDDGSCGFAPDGGFDNAAVSLGPQQAAGNGTVYHALFGGDPLDGGSNALLPTETFLGIDVDQDGTIEGTAISVDQILGDRALVATTDAGAYEAQTVLHCGIIAPTTVILGDVTVEVPAGGQGNLFCLRVTPYDTHHPAAPEGIQTGAFWRIDALTQSLLPASGYSVNLTIRVPFVPDAEDKLCRYTGGEPDWDCALDAYSQTLQTITRLNVTQLSEWAGGDDVGPTAITMASVSAAAGGGSGLWPALVGLVVVTVVVWRRRSRQR